MDIHDVRSYRRATVAADLSLADGEQFVAGGTWMFSEPQPGVTGLVDLTGMGWAAVEELESGGLRIGATCTIGELAGLGLRPGWPAQRLFADCAHALLASFKIWNEATVGGNICRSFAAAAMVSLAVALDGVAVIWTPDGAQRRLPVDRLITGNGTNSLRRGELLRAVDLPGHALRARAAVRKIALAQHGRSGAVVTGRIDDGRPDDGGGAVFTVTAATATPQVLRYRALPSAGRLHDDVLALEGYYSDPLGAADWRRAVSAVLAGELHAELSGDGRERR